MSADLSHRDPMTSARALGIRMPQPPGILIGPMEVSRVGRAWLWGMRQPCSIEQQASMSGKLVDLFVQRGIVTIGGQARRGRKGNEEEEEGEGGEKEEEEERK